ncbi:MAG: hypothetical protein WBQ94_08185, partial [Terracidiphilus sp.]
MSDHLRMNGSRPPAGEPIPRFPLCDSFLHRPSLIQRYKDDGIFGVREESKCKDNSKGNRGSFGSLWSLRMTAVLE